MKKAKRKGQENEEGDHTHKHNATTETEPRIAPRIAPLHLPGSRRGPYGPPISCLSPPCPRPRSGRKRGGQAGCLGSICSLA